MSEKDFGTILDVLSALGVMQDELATMARALDNIRQELAELLEKPK